MSDIKMSDVFGDELGGLLQSIEYAQDSPSSGEVNAIRIAINAYDANQERIADLDELRKNAMECIKSQRDEITDKSEEIKALKELLEMAVNAIEWFKDEHPESSSEADNEFLDSARSILKIKE